MSMKSNARQTHYKSKTHSNKENSNHETHISLNANSKMKHIIAAQNVSIPNAGPKNRNAASTKRRKASETQTQLKHILQFKFKFQSKFNSHPLQTTLYKHMNEQWSLSSSIFENHHLHRLVSPQFQQSCKSLHQLITSTSQQLYESNRIESQFVTETNCN